MCFFLNQVFHFFSEIPQLQYLNVVFLVATWEMLQEYGAITVRRGNTCLRLWMGRHAEPCLSFESLMVHVI